MTEIELKKYSVPIPDFFKKFYVEEELKDEFGIYRTGMYVYKGMHIFINKEEGTWHLSVSAKFPLGYQQLKDVRYKFMPDKMTVAQIFPPRDQFVNLQECTWHLWQIDKIEEVS
jgi:hypothetical protein